MLTLSDPIWINTNQTISQAMDIHWSMGVAEDITQHQICHHRTVTTHQWTTLEWTKEDRRPLDSAGSEDADHRCHSASIGVKLGKYDGSTCLETFLANVRNFTMCLHWTKKDELFHLCACIRGPASQMLMSLWLRLSLCCVNNLEPQTRPSGFGQSCEQGRYQVKNVGWTCMASTWSVSL